LMGLWNSAMTNNFFLQIMETPSAHHPEVYALPRDHDVVQQQNLTPCEDLTFLLDKYRRDVSALLGVPHEMIIGRDHGNHETVRKTIASGRIFSTNMHEVCRHLQSLLRECYCQIYSAKPEDVEFILVPMPRLEIETIQDFKILFEIGALTPDMTVKLSRILLGEEPGGKRKPSDQPNRNPPSGNAPGPTEPFPERVSSNNPGVVEGSSSASGGKRKADRG